MSAGPSPREQEERKAEFDHWLREKGSQIGFYAIPANKQSHVREMLRKAFNGGYNYRKRLDVGS